MEACANAVKQPVKAKLLSIFRSRHIDPYRPTANDVFDIYRLLCPDVRKNQFISSLVICMSYIRYLESVAMDTETLL
jgi:hypothetical protein